MQYKTIIRIIGLLIGLFSITMLPPALIAIWYNDGGGTAFIQAFFVSLFIGFWLWYPHRRCKEELRTREGFLIVVLFWTVLGSIGALPFIFSSQPDLSWTDSFFESFSALTTTGATVIVGLDSLPKAILFYRHLLQWLGGMGIIVLAVAILPVLGIGGMQLYRAEIPGPVKDSKMTPRIAETAKALWYIYLLLTISCAGAYWLAGMSMFDAICHSFSTIAIGGFSTHDASMGYFNSPVINLICVFFLIVSAVNFSVHFAAFSWRGINLKVYFRDTEFKVLVAIQLLLTAICFFTLYFYSDIYDTPEETLNHALFQAVSIATTTGFGTDSFNMWPLFLPMLLMFSSFIGGCGGSTAGGIKVIRVILLLLQGSRELKRLVHPKAMFSIRIGSKALPDRIVDAVWGFFFGLCFSFRAVYVGANGNGAR